MEIENGLNFRDGLELGWAIALSIVEKKHGDELPGYVIDEFNDIYTKLVDNYNSDRVKLMESRFKLQL